MAKLSDEELAEHRTRIASMYAIAAEAHTPRIGKAAFNANVVPVFDHITAQAEEIKTLTAERDDYRQRAITLTKMWDKKADELTAIKGRLTEDYLFKTILHSDEPNLHRIARAIISHVLGEHP
jgi:hypothetical protein